MKYPAITIPVHITAEEHERIAGFCQANRITLAEFITLRGVGFEMKEFSEDAINRAQLLGEAAERFGGGWPVTEEPGTRVVTVEFSRQAYAWLEAMTYYDGFATPADRIRASMAGDVASLTEALHEDEIKRVFGAPTGEERDAMLAVSRAANRDDLPLAAAAKPRRPEGGAR